MVTFINANETRQKEFMFDTPGKYVVFFHNLSGKFTVELSVENIEVDIFGLFTGKNADQFKVETVQHHKAPRSTSNLFIKGVFDGQSKFNYQGLIRIEKEGQHSHAYQKNQNLILSSEVFVESKPYLEILANDVFCTHGSTTGKLSKDEVYYLQTRGISEKSAQRLLVEGFMNDIIDKIREKVPEFEYDLPLSS